MADDTAPAWAARLESAFDTIVEYMGRDGDLSPADLANYEDTPARAARALVEMTQTKTAIKRRLADIVERAFPMEGEGTRDLISQGPIALTCLCPHHLMIAEVKAWIAYLPKPGGKVIGISKLARIATELAKRPVLQEQLAADIADVLYRDDAGNPVGWPQFESAGSAVLLVGRHHCMCSRGIRSNALTSVSVMRGIFYSDPTFEGKFDSYVKTSHAVSFGG